MRRLKIYLDTSVINFAVSDNPEMALRKGATVSLIERINKSEYSGYISELVLVEIDKSDEARRIVLRNYLKTTNVEILPNSSEAEQLADKYVMEEIIPEKYRDDAVHIALATISGIDFIVSWNFEHMVKTKTRRGVKAVNELFGYQFVDIVTPEEVE